MIQKVKSVKYYPAFYNLKSGNGPTGKPVNEKTQKLVLAAKATGVKM